MLKLRFINNKQNAVWLVEPKVTIGQGASCDLVLDHKDLKPIHAEIRVNHEQLHLLLLSDSVPVLLNAKVVPMGKLVVLRPKDRLRIADTELQIIDPKQESQASPTIPRQEETTGWALKANHAALANRVFPVNAKTLVGRSKECDLTLAAAHLSRRHAELSIKDGLMYVKDLGSANGTYVNGQRVTESRVKRGDDLRFDTLSFGVMGPTDDMDKTTVRPTAMTARKALEVGKGADKKAANTAVSHPSAVKKIPPARQTHPSRLHKTAPASAARPAPLRQTSVETIVPTERSGAVAVVTGGLLLLVIGVGVYLAWQSGWF